MLSVERLSNSRERVSIPWTERGAAGSGGTGGRTREIIEWIVARCVLQLEHP